MASLATRLRADREKAGLTVRELADQAGISFAYVSRIESGGAGRHIAPRIVFSLAKVLGADELEYLYLSKIVPPPLSRILSDARSRSFVRALLKASPKPADWDKLEAALPKSRGKNPAAKKKSR